MYISADIRESVFVFTTVLVESLQEQGFTEAQTRTAVLAALKTLFGAVWMIDPDSEIGEEFRQCSRGAFQAALARFYRAQ